MAGYNGLILASAAFVGTHFLMSHPLRKEMVRMLGPGGFALVYSVISLAAFVWMVQEFGRAPKAAVYWPATDPVWIVATILMLLAATLFVGSLVRNPSFPGASEKLAAQKPFGAYKATRHPMMWSFALWGFAHIIVAPRPDNIIFSGAIIFLALAGAKAQEIKKGRLVGVEWDAWLRQTSFRLRLRQLGNIGFAPWAAGLALWLAASWAHQYLGGYAAGVFRWL